MLDALMMGLGMPERRAQPAQTVMRFSLKEGRKLFEAGTELIGEAASVRDPGRARGAPCLG